MEAVEATALEAVIRRQLVEIHQTEKKPRACFNELQSV
jgi:hypothetical protein